MMFDKTKTLPYRTFCLFVNDIFAAAILRLHSPAVFVTGFHHFVAIQRQAGPSDVLTHQDPVQGVGQGFQTLHHSLGSGPSFTLNFKEVGLLPTPRSILTTCKA